LDVRRSIAGFLARFAAVPGSQESNRWQLPAIIFPTYAVDPFLDTRGDITYSEVQVAVGAGLVGNATLTVPPGQMWLLKHIAANSGPPAANPTTQSVALSVSINQATYTMPLTPWTIGGLLNLVGARVTQTYSRDFALNPGDVLNASLANTSVLAVNVQLTALYRVVELQSL
jgi:hypothetical protein